LADEVKVEGRGEISYNRQQRSTQIAGELQPEEGQEGRLEKKLEARGSQLFLTKLGEITQVTK